MSELLTFLELGFRHITDVTALDHVLFLLALAVIYRGRDWRDAVWVVSAFTVGHSITLALAVTGSLRIGAEWIEFLIPVTIVATCIENLILVRRPPSPWRRRYRPMLAGAFGLVHGAGFANYLRSVFPGEGIVLPLVGFNVGVELAQLAVLALLTLLFAGADRLLHLVRRSAEAATRWRVVTVSLAVSVIAVRWALLRSPW